MANKSKTKGTRANTDMSGRQTVSGNRTGQPEDKGRSGQGNHGSRQGEGGNRGKRGNRGLG